MAVHPQPPAGIARVLIVDDESLARRGVRVCLEANPEFRVVGECASGRQAVVQIAALKPDVVFLDIKMRDISGFDVIAQLDQETTPLIVFLTAHDEFALKAFDSQATDYVLKPIDDGRFQEALQRVRERLRDRSARRRLAEMQSALEAARNVTTKYLTKFAVRNGSRVTIVDAERVSWISAAGDYVLLHDGAKQFLIRESLERLEQQLDPNRFVRVHRSNIVALSKIRQIYSLPSRDYELRLEDGTRLRASRRFKERLRAKLAVTPR